MKHTPGKWSILTHNGRAVEVSAPWPGMKGRLKIAKIEESDEREGNAKLIAAAPELLEALQLFKEIDKEYRGIMPVLLRGFREKAEEAIKKATV